MIEIVQGVPGSGKSYFCTYKIVQALKMGCHVVANVNLVDGWHYKLADTWLNRYRGIVPFMAQRYLSHYRCTMNVDEILSLRLPGRKEGRGLMIFDESSLIFNSRDWQSRDNRKWIKFFQQHRKLGWNVYLVSHRAENLDSQVRYLAEYWSSLRSMKALKLPVIGLPLSPYPVFLKLRYYAGIGAGSGQRESVNIVPLIASIADIYDTTEMFGIQGDTEILSDDSKTAGSDGSLAIGRPYLSKLHSRCLWSTFDLYQSDHLCDSSSLSS